MVETTLLLLQTPTTHSIKTLWLSRVPTNSYRYSLNEQSDWQILKYEHLNDKTVQRHMHTFISSTNDIEPQSSWTLHRIFFSSTNHWLKTSRSLTTLELMEFKSKVSPEKPFLPLEQISPYPYS